jgi:hypothetical protein
VSDDDTPIPKRVVPGYSIGELPEGDILIRLKYVTSMERYEAGQTDELLFEMDREQASEFAASLQRVTASQGRRRPH